MLNTAKITLIGNAGRDPESKVAQNGKPFVTFTVAVSNKIGGRDNVSWFRVSCFNNLAEQMKSMLKKGNPVYVEGRVECRKFIDASGASRESFDVLANEVILLSPKAAEPTCPTEDIARDDEY